MKKRKWLTAKILGIKVDFINLEEALVWVEDWIKYNKKGQIVTPNAEQIVLAQKDKEFRKILNHADLAICDGMGLLLAARFLSLCSPAAILISPSESNSRKNPDTEKEVIGGRIVKAHKIGQARRDFTRLSGTDLMLALCQKAAEEGWRVFLLGGKKGVAAEAAKKLDLGIISCHCEDPPAGGDEAISEIASLPRQTRIVRNDKIAIAYDKGSVDIAHETERERKRIMKKINKFRPQLLFVAYGAPYQEKWIAKNLPKLKVNLAMGVGGAFDYLSGKVARAPKWLRLAGFEWLWRLVHQPWRIRRQLRLIKFVWLVIKNRSFALSLKTTSDGGSKRLLRGEG